MDIHHVWTFKRTIEIHSNLLCSIGFIDQQLAIDWKIKESSFILIVSFSYCLIKQ